MKKNLGNENVELNIFFIVVIAIIHLHLLLTHIYGRRYIDMENIISGIISGTAAGIAVSFILWIYKINTMPKLNIEFDANDTYYLGSDNKLYVHLKIVNSRKTMAKNCKVFLLNFEKKENDEYRSTPNPHLNLKWAHEFNDKGYDWLEIPGNYRRKVDLIYGIHENIESFKLFIEPGARGVESTFPHGEYLFTVQTSGENTNVVRKNFILRWKKGTTFTKDNIEITPM